MNEMTKFTHIRFVSVIKTQESLDKLKAVLGRGFVFLSGMEGDTELVLVYRDILFSQKEVKKGTYKEKEYLFLERHFKEKAFPAECLGSYVWQEGIINIPTKEVMYEGRTVALLAYLEGEEE